MGKSKENAGKYTGGEVEFALLRKDDTGELWHPGLELVFMLRGTGMLYEADADMVHKVKEGDVFAVNGFDVRRIELEADALAITLVISPAFIAEFSTEASQLNIKCKSFLYGEEQQEPFDVIRRDFARAFSAYYKDEAGRFIGLKAKIVILLDDLFRGFAEKEPKTGTVAGKERLKTAVAYIQEHFRENISLEDLAQKTYMSKTYLSHSFQKYLGISFFGYLTQVWVVHAVMLLNSSRTLTEIAYESGFSNANAMIKAFKQYKGTTPGEYRKKLGLVNQERSSKLEQAELGFGDAFSTLMRYMNGQPLEDERKKESVCEAAADFLDAGKECTRHWKMVINAGYARDLLNGTIQKEIKRVQKKIGFRYIRIKGILNDEMGVFVQDMLGNTSANYAYVDLVLDFILSVGARPFLELSGMPGVLAEKVSQFTVRQMFFSAAADFERWSELIRDMLEHLKERYGQNEIRNWLFSPWMAPDFVPMGYYSWEMYEKHYCTAYRLIREILPGAKICGPGTADCGSTLLGYLDMCKRTDCIPDYLTLKSFAAVNPEEEKSGLKLIGNNESFYMAVSGDENYLQSIYQKARKVMKKAGIGKLPLVLEEWSNTVWQRDLCNDTCYKSAYIFKAIIENEENYAGMGYFTLSDQIDEILPAAEIFHGGFGLFTRNNLPKSVFRAMELLNQMGDRILLRKPGILITANDRQVQIFLYNYCHYDMLYRYRHIVNMSETDRYRVFLEKESVMFQICLKNLPEGKGRIRRYGITKEGGSVYDAWVAMGAPRQMDRLEEKYLARLSWPKYQTEEMEIRGDVYLQARLLPHEVQMITVEISGKYR